MKVDAHSNAAEAAQSQRSANMSRIRSRDTKPELRVRRALHALGYRFRLHRRDLPGTPDIVLPKWRTVVFVHGCFWHSHGCSIGKLPKSRLEYWLPKLERNRNRHELACSKLSAIGWEVITIWECDVRSAVDLKSKIKSLLETG